MSLSLTPHKQSIIDSSVSPEPVPCLHPRGWVAPATASPGKLCSGVPPIRSSHAPQGQFPNQDPASTDPAPCSEKDPKKALLQPLPHSPPFLLFPGQPRGAPRHHPNPLLLPGTSQATCRSQSQVPSSGIDWELGFRSLSGTGNSEVLAIISPVPSAGLAASQEKRNKYKRDDLLTRAGRPHLAVAPTTQAGWRDIPILQAGK